MKLWAARPEWGMTAVQLDYRNLLHQQVLHEKDLCYLGIGKIVGRLRSIMFWNDKSIEEKLHLILTPRSAFCTSPSNTNLSAARITAFSGGIFAQLLMNLWQYAKQSCPPCHLKRNCKSHCDVVLLMAAKSWYGETEHSHSINGDQHVRSFDLPCKQ